MNPIISVIVPVYNVEAFLHKCVDSIISQTYKHLEIILVNDGSQDNSALICDDYAKKNERIKVIHQENKGPSAARNAGLEIATGDYIGFIDSDDWIYEIMYETLINNALIHESDLTSCVVQESNKIKNEVQLKNQKSIILNKKELLYNCLNFGFYIPRNLYSKKLIKNLKLDENIPFVEDIFFGIEVIEKVDKSVFIDFPFYIYNDANDMSLTRVNYNKNSFLTLDANIYLQKKVAEMFPHDTELHTITRERIIGNCLYHFQNIHLQSNAHLDKDSVMKIKMKKIYNNNFIFLKNPSVLKSIIRLLTISQLKYFYRFYYFITKK